MRSASSHAKWEMRCAKSICRDSSLPSGRTVHSEVRSPCPRGAPHAAQEQHARPVGVEHHVVEPHQAARRLRQRGGPDHPGMGEQQLGAPGGQVDAVQPVIFRRRRQGRGILVVGVADHGTAVVHARVVESQRLPPVGRHRGHRRLQHAGGAAGAGQRVRHHPRPLPCIAGKLLAAPGVDPVQHAALLQVERGRLRKGLERPAGGIHQADPRPIRRRGRAAVEVAFQSEVEASAAVPRVDAVVAEEVVGRPVRKPARRDAHGTAVYLPLRSGNRRAARCRPKHGNRQASKQVG